MLAPSASLQLTSVPCKRKCLPVRRRGGGEGRGERWVCVSNLTLKQTLRLLGLILLRIKSLKKVLCWNTQRWNDFGFPALKKKQRLEVLYCLHPYYTSWTPRNSWSHLHGLYKQNGLIFLKVHFLEQSFLWLNSSWDVASLVMLLTLHDTQKRGINLTWSWLKENKDNLMWNAKLHI